MQNSEAFELKNSLDLNCAQTILAYFAPEFKDKIDKDALVALGLNFGGGMNRGGVCGAISAAYMLLGLKFFDKSKDHVQNKAARLAKTREFDEKFANEIGLRECKELLKFDINYGEVSSDEIVRAAGVCGGCLATSINILNQMLKQD